MGILPHIYLAHGISYFETGILAANAAYRKQVLTVIDRIWAVLAAIMKKGGILLSATGHILVRAYASKAQIPLQDVAVMISDINGNAIAMRLTDRSGLTTPVEISVPDRSASQTPNTGITPFATVNITARLENYEQIEAQSVQVFPDTITYQNLEMIPLSELPQQWDKSEFFDTPPQNL